MFEGSFQCDLRATQNEHQAGIMVFCMAGRVLHANRTAQRFARLAWGE